RPAEVSRPRADGGHAATLVVDAQGGHDARFLDLQSAIDRAAPDDLILVRPGSYSGFTLEKGVALVAQPSGSALVSGPITVKALPPGQRARLIGLALVSTTGNTGVTVSGCKGAVFLQSIRADVPVATRPLLRVEDSAPVHLIDCHLRAGGGRLPA